MATCLHNVKSANPFKNKYNNVEANPNFPEQNKAWIFAAVGILAENDNTVPEANVCPNGPNKKRVVKYIAMC